MRIASVTLRDFKRFAHLTIRNLPASARLVVLAGPNGFGKSSLFDAFHLWSNVHHGGRGVHRHDDYYDRPADERSAMTIDNSAKLGEWAAARVSLQFHGQQPFSGTAEAKKSFYVRSAYRNEPELQFGGIQRLGSALDENRPQRLIEAHPAVSLNYTRLVSDAFEDAFERDEGTTKLAVWRERIIGELRHAMTRLFPDLILDSLGSPMRDPTFRFTKGRVHGFAYTNLSGGERAAFDLLLDLIVKRREYDDTAYCIDEPDLHLNPRVHGVLLDELLNLLPALCQLWVATHSVGMLRRARDIEARAPGTVVFLDFEGQKLDAPTEMHPCRPTRTFWENALRVALDDLADLVAPREVVVCEGNPASPVAGKNAEHDVRCYTTIFGDEVPDTVFVAGGNSHDVLADRLGFAAKLPAIVRGARVRRLIDRDDHGPADVEEHVRSGVNVLERRNIESYLYDDEVLCALCKKYEKPEQLDGLLAAKEEAMRNSVRRRNPPDDLKPAAPEIYLAAKRLLSLTGVGNDARAFERNVLAGLIVPGMAVYGELRRSVFPIADADRSP